MRDQIGSFDLLDAKQAILPGQGYWNVNPQPNFRAGGGVVNVFQASPYVVGALTTQAMSINQLYATPLFSGPGGTIDSTAIEATAISAGSQTRVGMYDSDPTTLLPASLIFSSGILDTSVANVLFVNAIPPLRLAAGRIFWAVRIAGTANPTLRAGAGVLPFWGQSVSANGPQFCLRVAMAFGALPATFPSIAAAGDGPTAIGVDASATTLFYYRWLQSP